MTDDTHSEEIEAVRDALKEFLTEFNRAVDGDLQKIERVLNGSDTLTTSDLGSTPESWTEDALITPLLQAVGLNKVPGRPSSQRETPDFRLNEEFGEIVGENKSPNNIETAEKELVEEYISKKSWSDYGIATDGFEWVVYRAERGGDFIEYTEVRRVDLRNTLQELARENGIIGQQAVTDTDLEDGLTDFVEVFTPAKLGPILTKEAPQQFRDQRKQDVEEFYELYIELLFGESDEYNGKYETCLRNDLITPPENSKKENDVFAVTLVNRLLFLKFLERHEVLPEGFLIERVNDYNENVPGTLYKTIIEPIFYDLMNTPKDGRRPDHRSGWFTDVPYLNGGLFRESIPNESDYDVLDRTLPLIITDLIEGHELNLEFDPAVLGSVFEKTINHLSESEDRQKEIGAYYTPNDVTKVVNEGAVDRKIRDTIIECYTEELSQPDEFKSEVDDMDLEEMLSHIEDGSGWFGNTHAMEKAQQRVTNLKIADPACGSGHFLTAAMEEVNQVQKSLYRGVHGGEEPSGQENYEMKKQLALNAIYGVDVDPVGAEIAKLRVWLKIVEGNGWTEDFSRLPNIDINILSGNSLIGLPAKSTGQASLSGFNIDLKEIEIIREQYKDEEIDRDELNRRINSVKPELREKYLSRVNHYFEDRIQTRSDWENTVVTLDSLYPTIRKATVRRTDNEALSKETKSRLDDAGFRVEPRYGKSAKVEDSDLDSINRDIFAELLEEDFLLDVERQPTLSDLDEIEQGDDLSYGPFHWVIEFPEVVSEEQSGYSVEFDVIVGNPPYGNVLTTAEKRFVKGYRTGNINDISMPFIERQLQLIDEGGYFGNIHSMGLLYQGSAAPARTMLREKLADGQMACFGHRPATVFEGANPRAAITTGQKTSSEEDEHDFYTSEFILFYPDERDAAFRSIEYSSVDDLVLGSRIGDEETNKAYPKVGSNISRNILETLRDYSDRVFEDVITRRDPETTDHVVYRSYHPLYWVNPFLENIYEDYGNSPPRDFEPMYFETEVERKAAFLILQSSTFYHYWMTYENQRDLNWGPIKAFPFPSHNDLEEIEEELDDIAEDLWQAMKHRFNGREISNGAQLKPIVDRADELLGPLLGLNEDQIEWLKDYHTEFGRATEETDEVLTETAE